MTDKPQCVECGAHYPAESHHKNCTHQPAKQVMGESKLKMSMQDADATIVKATREEARIAHVTNCAQLIREFRYPVEMGAMTMSLDQILHDAACEIDKHYGLPGPEVVNAVCPKCKGQGFYMGRKDAGSDLEKMTCAFCKGERLIKVVKGTMVRVNAPEEGDPS